MASERGDLLTWPLLSGPVLQVTARLGDLRFVIYTTPGWTPPTTVMELRQDAPELSPLTGEPGASSLDMQPVGCRTYSL